MKLIFASFVLSGALLLLALWLVAGVNRSGLSDSGIKASPEELVACKAEGCTVWTDEEIKALMNMVFGMGRDAATKGKRI